MPKGVKIEELAIGTGKELTKGMEATVKVRYFLNRGDEIWTEWDATAEERIGTDDRRIIAGLRYGMIGMRVDGRRALVISPHLAYGRTGCGEEIPPNAALRCEVELIGAEEPWGPEATTRVRQASVVKWGEGLESFQSASFSIDERDEVSGGGLTGRDLASLYGSRFQLPVEARIAFVAEAVRILEEHREECLFRSQVFIDVSPSCRQMRREKAKGTPCIHIQISENRRKLASYYLREDSPRWLNSYMCQIMNWLLSQASQAPEAAGP